MKPQGRGGDSHSSVLDVPEVALLLAVLLVGAGVWFVWSKIGSNVERSALLLARAFLVPFLWIPGTDVGKNYATLPFLAARPALLTLHITSVVWNYVGRFWDALLLPAMAFMAADLWKKERLVSSWRHKYTMESLLEEQAKIFPTQSNALKSRFWEKDSVTGRWSAPAHPYVWAVAKGIISDLDNGGKPVAYSSLRIESGHPIKEGGYDPRRYGVNREAALKAFSQQLSVGSFGPRRDLSRYPFPLRLLTAVFIVKGIGGKGSSVADDWLSEAARSFEVKNGIPQMPVFRDGEIRKALADGAKHPDVRYILESHAYMVPTMMSLLQFARGKGVLIGPDFLWLRPMDTVLWRALNQTGNTVAWIEAAGAMAHWQAETALSQLAGRPSPLLDPTVDSAVDGLEAFLKDETEGWIHDLAKNKRD